MFLLDVTSSKIKQIRGQIRKPSSEIILEKDDDGEKPGEILTECKTEINRRTGERGQHK